MPSYCSLTDLKSYLNITTTTDDVLLQLMLDSATNRIDEKCGRVFAAYADETRVFDIDQVKDGELQLDADLSYITSVTNGDTANIVASIYKNPRNKTPYYSLGIKSNASASWVVGDSEQESISIVGRWAYMQLANITAISRSAGNVVNATVNAPKVSVGMTVYVLGVADTGFNGAFTVTANTGSTLTWAQSGGADTDTTGTLLYTPTEIVHACRRLAAWLYRQKDTQQGDIDRPLLAGDGTVIMPTTLPADVEILLHPYVKNL
jgi:hypothetical protein